MIVRANLDAHDPDFDLRMCRRCGLTWEALEARAVDDCASRPPSDLGLDGAIPLSPPTWNLLPETSLPPSDLGLDGAIPLPPPTWLIQHDETLWAAQNRKINDLLSGRAG